MSPGILLLTFAVLVGPSGAQKVEKSTPTKAADEKTADKRLIPRKNLPEELREIERDVIEARKRLDQDAYPYLKQLADALNRPSRKAKETGQFEEHSSAFKDMAEQLRLLQGSVRSENEELKKIEAFLDSASNGKPHLSDDDATWLKRETEASGPLYAKFEDAYSATSISSERRGLNESLKRHESTIHRLIDEFARNEPDRSKEWLDAKQLVGLRPLRELVGKLRSSSRAVARATEGSIEYFNKQKAAPISGNK